MTAYDIKDQIFPNTDQMLYSEYITLKKNIERMQKHSSKLLEKLTYSKYIEIYIYKFKLMLRDFLIDYKEIIESFDLTQCKFKDLYYCSINTYNKNEDEISDEFWKAYMAFTDQFDSNIILFTTNKYLWDKFWINDIKE